MAFDNFRNHVSKLLAVSALGIGFLGAPPPEPVAAQVCNVFGCSQPGAGACNPFGCPNPGAGECTPFGCPSPPPSPSNNTNDSRRDFTVYNNTGTNITALYLSDSSDSTWGSNDLSNLLYSGNSIRYSLTGGCQWDLRVQLANGGEITQYAIDTCLNASYSLGGNVTQPAPSSSANGSGVSECMDRVMYQEFRAYTGPDRDGWYRFNLPSSLSNDQVRQAGFRYSTVRSDNQNQQSVVRVQVETAEQAAQTCR